jgi:hypothetical protein
MRVLASGWLALAMMTAVPAAADWQYTKWGMTPEQVIKAAHSRSKQVARLVDQQQKAAEDAGRVAQKALLSGDWSSGRFQFEVRFFFDSHRKLASVELTLANSENEGDLINELTKRYGAPVASDSSVMEFRRWRTPTEEIWFYGGMGPTPPVGARATSPAIPASVVYVPRHSADNGGL